MRSEAIAEWLIGRCVGDERASSLIGDLVEARAQQGSLWFWFSLARVLVAVAWRRVLALLAAFYVAQTIFGSFLIVGFGPDMQLTATRRLRVAVIVVLCAACAILWTVGVHTAVRYGLRDKVTRLSLALATLVSLGLLFAPEHAASIALIAITFVAIASIQSTNYRGSAKTVIAASATGVFGCLVSILLENSYRTHLVAHGVRGGQMSLHPEIGYLGFALTLLTVLATTSISSRLHDWSAPQPLVDSEDGDGVAS